MRIAVLFNFHDQGSPSAVTEIEGPVTDIVLPAVGDTVTHTDFHGRRFRAQVVGRHFDYSLSDGEDVNGAITVVLTIKHVPERNVH